VNFTNTVIIMTSNIGSNLLLNGEANEDVIMSALRSHFKPELLNRMDEIITFHPLSDQHFHAIAKKYITQLQERVAKQEVQLIVDDEVIDWVVKHGADAQFGARPLKRFVQRHVETFVAKQLLAVNEQQRTIHLTINNDELTNI